MDNERSLARDGPGESAHLQTQWTVRKQTCCQGPRQGAMQTVHGTFSCGIDKKNNLAGAQMPPLQKAASQPTNATQCAGEMHACAFWLADANAEMRPPPMELHPKDSELTLMQNAHQNVSSSPSLPGSLDHEGSETKQKNEICLARCYA